MVTDVTAATPSLSELAYTRLRDLVVTGKLQPGERVTERALQTQLGLGASPVRAALSRLDTEGLVATLPRRGYQISPLTLQSIEDLFDVWQIIGPAMVGIAVKRLGPDGVTELQGDLVAQVVQGESPVQAARRAWTAIAEATSNRHLIDTFARLELHLARVLYLTVQYFDTVPGPGHGHHDSMVETLRLTDAAEMQRRTASGMTSSERKSPMWCAGSHPSSRPSRQTPPAHSALDAPAC